MKGKLTIKSRVRGETLMHSHSYSYSPCPPEVLFREVEIFMRDFDAVLIAEQLLGYDNEKKLINLFSQCGKNCYS